MLENEESSLSAIEVVENVRFAIAEDEPGRDLDKVYVFVSPLTAQASMTIDVVTREGRNVRRVELHHPGHGRLQDSLLPRRTLVRILLEPRLPVLGLTLTPCSCAHPDCHVDRALVQAGSRWWPLSLLLPPPSPSAPRSMAVTS